MNQNNIILFIGAPGSGKGSISKLSIDNFGWRQLSTGNLCRDHIARQTDVGKKIDFIIKSGKLISDDLVTEMVENWLENNLSSTVIFDGYPRTIVQANSLCNLLKNRFTKSNLKLIRFLVDEQTLTKRLSSRIVCSNNKCQAVYSTIPGSSLLPREEGICDKCISKLIKRDDDNEKAIKERLIQYMNSEKELLNFFKNLGFEISEIKADQPIEIMFADFKKLVN